MKLINCLLLLIVIFSLVNAVQAEAPHYDTVIKITENTDCKAVCHNQDTHVIHEMTSATCQQCHGATLTDKQPACNKCHSDTIHNAPTENVETLYEVLGAINATGTTFKATSIDNPAVLYYDLEDRDGYGSITFPLYDNLSIPNGKLNYTTILWG
ncbi:MAG: hypothetical protein K8S27_09565, partial [Candidatus Omnitrophica bacterium]|nr:hypothetical protein [Candidatus Omnitrophota bacterium]